MSEIPDNLDENIRKLIEILPKLIKENDTIKGAIITALTGVVATREDIKDLIKMMNERFDASLEEMNQRFEALQKEMDRRFEALQKEMDRRFEALQKEMDRRFEAVDKRFEQIDRRFESVDRRFNQIDRRFESVDRRFEQIDRRFDELHKEMDERFEKMENNFAVLNRKIDNLAESLGVSFEQFGRNVIRRVIKAEGLGDVELKSARIPNPPQFKKIFDHDELEIDGFSIDPPIIAEITSMLYSRDKVEKFIKKKQVIEKIFNKTFRGFFIASRTKLDEDEIKEIREILKENNYELLNL